MKPPREIPAAMRAFWATFESTQPGSVSDRFYELCIFGDDEQTADALADLALRRVKRATAGLVWAYEAEGMPIPKPGDLSILANWRKEPLGIIETLRLDILPFVNVTAGFAAVEGEGDRCERPCPAATRWKKRRAPAVRRLTPLREGGFEPGRLRAPWPVRPRIAPASGCEDLRRRSRRHRPA